jgi:thiol-disulfide isomerase/thioredoxin
LNYSKFNISSSMRKRRHLKLLLLGGALMASFLPTLAETLPVSVLNAALVDIDKQPHHISDWNGKLRVLNFWATWCVPCRGEIPVLQSAADTWRDDIVVIGVALDNARDVRRFSQQAGIRYPLLLAEGNGPSMMKIGGNLSGALPYTLLVDGRGNILQRHSGPIAANQLDRWLREAVVNTSSSN